MLCGRVLAANAPDELQPKAYCTNPRLYSFLLAPPGVSTRDPSSERMELLGREMADEFCLKMPDFHVTFRDLLHAVNLRHRTNGFTSLHEGRRAEDFFRPEKSDGFGRV